MKSYKVSTCTIDTRIKSTGARQSCDYSCQFQVSDALQVMGELIKLEETQQLLHVPMTLHLTIHLQKGDESIGASWFLPRNTALILVIEYQPHNKFVLTSIKGYCQLWVGNLSPLSQELNKTWHICTITDTGFEVLSLFLVSFLPLGNYTISIVEEKVLH